MTAAPANPVSSPLASPVTSLWGVGLERAAQLARLGIRTVEDLLLHRTRRYEDRRQFGTIAELQLDVPATTRGKVVALGLKRFRGGQKSVFELILDDGTPNREWRKASVIFRHLPSLKKRIEELEQRVAELTEKLAECQPSDH